MKIFRHYNDVTDAFKGAVVALGNFDGVHLGHQALFAQARQLAGAGPVVAYRLDPVSYALARRLVKTPHIALPNVLLGRRAFPELLQDAVTPARIAPPPSNSRP